MTEAAFNIAAATREELGLKVLEEVSRDQPDLYQMGKYISAGANLEQLDTEGNTPLLLAALHNRAGAAEVLINGGANVTATDAKGNMPFNHADTNHNLALMKMLIDREAAGPPRSQTMSFISSEMWDRHMDNIREKIDAAEAQRTHFAVLRPFSFKKPA